MKTLRKPVIAALLVALVASCGGPVTSSAPSATPAADASGRVEVRLTSGPTCPVEQNPPDPNCAARPVADEVVTVATGGVEIARGRTDAEGRIAFSLVPGEYTVTGLNETGFMGRPEPATVLVADSAVITVDLEYDTGIR